MPVFINIEVISSDLDKYLIFFQGTCRIYNSDEDTGIWKQNSRLFLQVYELIQLHAMQDRRQYWVTHDIETLD